MDIKDLLNLVVKASAGEDDLDQAAVGFHGYGFIFKDPLNSKEEYVITSQSGKVCGMGAYRNLLKKWFSEHNEISNIDDLLLYDEKYDCLYGGSLKTLLPTLEFGGDENLFDVWMFIKTPEEKKFPATFYFGPSGTSFGGWKFHKYQKVFSNDFSQIINCCPFDFSEDELEGLIEALECTLKKVPVADFYGVYHHDLGNALMGVKSGIPFIIELGYEYDETDIEFFLEEVENFKDKFDEVYKKKIN